MNIGTVVEGPTDRLMLKAIIQAIYPGDHRFFDLQPVGQSDSFGEMGTGWKGVRKWCQETHIRFSLGEIIYADPSAPLDILIVQLDADIAVETDLQDELTEQILDVYSPCPPIGETTYHLKQIVAAWLQISLEDSPSQMIFAIPSQDMENWLFAALFPNDPLCKTRDYECIKPQKYPGYLLTLQKYHKILRRDGTTIKKPITQYRNYVPGIISRWGNVRRICSQAETFHHELMNLCPPSD